MSFLHKLTVSVLGFIFSTIIIGILLMVVGIISIPQMYAMSNLKSYAEDYVAKTYGDHYNVSGSKIDGVRYNVFQDYVYGVEYTFSDKNKNESDFVIYVGNDDGTNKTVTDKRYYARNEYLIEQCFSKYTKAQLKQNNLPTNKCDVEVSIYDPEYVLYTNHALTYENYEDIISDTSVAQHLDISVNITISDKSQNNNDYSETAKALYEYFNKAPYRNFEFYFTDIKHKSFIMNIYSGVSINGQPNKNYVPQNAASLDPYYYSYTVNDIKLSN